MDKTAKVLTVVCAAGLVAAAGLHYLLGVATKKDAFDQCLNKTLGPTFSYAPLQSFKNGSVVIHERGSGSSIRIHEINSGTKTLSTWWEMPPTAYEQLATKRRSIYDAGQLCSEALFGKNLKDGP